MPIYVYKCETCTNGKGKALVVEELQPRGTNELNCPKCKKLMVKQIGSIGLVLMNGQYPSFRREYLKTAPYTTRDTSPNKKIPHSNPYPQDPETVMQGEKWLESLE